MLGGGVGDSYQPIEKQYQLTRKTLQLLRAYRRPVHVLTKSILVERDLDIIKKINQQNKAIVSFSFSTTDDKLASIYEPGVPPPTKRLQTLKTFKEQGIATGMFLLPVIPFITDSQKQITAAIRYAKRVGVDFVIFGVMTLKRGKQADYFIQELKQENPDIIDKINSIYRNDKWGSPSSQYYNKINGIFSLAAKKYQIPKRIPSLLYKDILSENDLVVVILEHIDYLQKLTGIRSSFGYVAYQISKIRKPLSTIKNQISTIKGINQKIKEIILEILETKKSNLLEKLLFN
jgi:DNA repair photolyase